MAPGETYPRSGGSGFGAVDRHPSLTQIQASGCFPGRRFGIGNGRRPTDPGRNLECGSVFTHLAVRMVSSYCARGRIRSAERK